MEADGAVVVLSDLGDGLRKEACTCECGGGRLAVVGEHVVASRVGGQRIGRAAEELAVSSDVGIIVAHDVGPVRVAETIGMHEVEAVMVRDIIDSVVPPGR